MSVCFVSATDAKRHGLRAVTPPDDSPTMVGRSPGISRPCDCAGCRYRRLYGFSMVGRRDNTEHVVDERGWR